MADRRARRLARRRRQPTRADFDRFFGGYRTRTDRVVLAQIAERIAGSSTVTGGSHEHRTTAHRSRPPLDAELERCCGGCGCRTSARPPPRCWPPPRRNAGNPPRCCERCSPRRSPGGTGPRWRPGGPRAGFPTGKTFAAWDPALSSIPAPTQQALRTLEWIAPPREPGGLRARPAPARRSCSKPSASKPSRPGCHVAWFTLEDLGALVRRHRADDTVTKAIGRILRADLSCVDDIGLLPVGADAAEGLYRARRRRLRETLHRAAPRTCTPPGSTS